MRLQPVQNKKRNVTPTKPTDTGRYFITASYNMLDKSCKCFILVKHCDHVIGRNLQANLKQDTSDLKQKSKKYFSYAFHDSSDKTEISLRSVSKQGTFIFFSVLLRLVTPYSSDSLLTIYDPRPGFRKLPCYLGSCHVLISKESCMKQKTRPN